MKKLFLLTCVLLLSAGIAAAQDTPPSGDQPTQPAQSETAPADTTDQTTLRGCLSGSGENFTFTDQAGISYRLGGNFAMLGEHVGHDVELTGKLGDTSAASDQPADQKLFEVANVKMVAETCSTTDTARPEGDAAMTQPETQVATEQPVAPAAADPNAPVAATDPNAAVTPSAPVQQPEVKVEPEVAVQAEPVTPAEEPVTPDAVEQPVVEDTDEQEATEELPQTATFLPLLGLLGFGSLAAGLLIRRK